MTRKSLAAALLAASFLAGPAAANQKRGAVDKQAVNQISAEECRRCARAALNQGIMRRVPDQRLRRLKPLPPTGGLMAF